MDIDYDKILKAMVVKKPQTEAGVSQKRLHEKAQNMAWRGYAHTKTSLKALEAYLQGYGILLSGGVGVGKTMFFRTVEPDGGVAILPCNSFTLWRYDELTDWLDAHRAEDICVDDLGWDRVGDAMSRNYGQKYDALQIVLDFRLRCSSRRTHFTTNLTNDALLKAYDYHIVDRIYGLVKPFVFDRKMTSRREAHPNARTVMEYELTTKKENAK